MNKYIIEGKLHCLEALHIGSDKLDFDFDALFIRNKDNKAYIPGSSLKGVFRGLFEEFGLDNIDKIFGFASEKSQISKIFIPDLIQENIEKEFTRDSIAINKETGTTVHGSKFDYNVLPKGSIFPFKMIIKNIKEDELPLIGLILKEMEHEFFLGGKKSRGIGKCKLVLKKMQYIDSVKDYIFNNVMGLKSTREEIYKEIIPKGFKPTNKSKIDNELIVKLKIIPKSPLLIKEGTGKDEVTQNKIKWLKIDSGEYMIDGASSSDNKEKGKLLLPGSTLKGLFRHSFEKIYSARGTEIGNLFGSIQSKSRFWISDGETGVYEPKERSITPIDRFTGGALVPLSFEYITQSFQTEMRIKDIGLEELRALCFFIRDSQNGEIRIGNSKTRGFGEVEIKIDELLIKDYKKQRLFSQIKDYFSIESSVFYDVWKLKEKNKEDNENYKEINENNKFIEALFSEVKE